MGNQKKLYFFSYERVNCDFIQLRIVFRSNQSLRASQCASFQILSEADCSRRLLKKPWLGLFTHRPTSIILRQCELHIFQYVTIGTCIMKLELIVASVVRGLSYAVIGRNQETWRRDSNSFRHFLSTINWSKISVLFRCVFCFRRLCSAVLEAWIIGASLSLWRNNVCN